MQREAHTSVSGSVRPPVPGPSCGWRLSPNTKISAGWGRLPQPEPLPGTSSLIICGNSGPHGGTPNCVLSVAPRFAGNCHVGCVRAPWADPPLVLKAHSSVAPGGGAGARTGSGSRDRRGGWPLAVPSRLRCPRSVRGHVRSQGDSAAKTRGLHFVGPFGDS